MVFCDKKKFSRSFIWSYLFFYFTSLHIVFGARKIILISLGYACAYVVHISNDEKVKCALLYRVKAGYIGKYEKVLQICAQNSV